ncbi:hypothetical protein M422DRAFT_182859 [Sphaerobolus stellatus SS14]|uniref:Uncharacterized protein n=1 Tax=Sphaerobolus stellatus (strain SS14) TaxID=990650 RepID=A0A0C9UWS3_SPHS4|nr:hypothetical protein M422DRAFT_182859 [Sphaerobolus stellatus SS14]
MLLISFVSFIIYSLANVGASPLPTASPDAPPLTFDLLPSNSTTTCIPLSSDNQRSLSDIVWSCLATTFAVTWVAVHPNIPSRDEKWWWITLRRLKAMFLALLAPELMLLWAWRQRQDAKYIRKKILELSKEDPAFKKDWTMVHGHYLQMGGFVLHILRPEDLQTQDTFDISPPGPGPNGFSVLHYNTLERLMREGRLDFPSISEPEIKDKSKSDALGKTVASAQIIWFITQVVARRARGLAITEIELTTSALAALNTVMYFLWWDKPFDVQCPSIVRLKSQELPAEMNSSSRNEQLHHYRHRHYHFSSYSTRDRSSVRGWLPGKSHVFSTFCWGFSHHLRFVSIPTPITELISDVSLGVQEAVEALYYKKGCLYTNIALISPFTQTLRELTRGEEKAVPADRVGIFHTEHQDAEEIGSIRRFYITMAVGCIFGGLHLIGWSFSFPSRVEMLAWRISGCVIATMPAWFTPLMVLFYRYENNRIGKVFAAILHLLFFMYITGRLFLAVESLISLRQLPPSAFENVG